MFSPLDIAVSPVDLSPRSGPRQILRSFAATLLLGIALVAALRAADTAGRSVVALGLLATFAAAAIAGVVTARRVRDVEAIAERLSRLADSRADSRADAPTRLARDRAPTTEMLFRRIAETQHGVRHQIAILEAERRRGFHVLGHMTDGVLAVGADRRVLLLNPAARHLLGLGGASLLGRRVAEVVRIPQIIAATDAVLGGKGAQEVAFQFPGNGELFLIVQAIELPAEGSPGALLTIRDETKLRQLERMRREFIANVSHELKTPLAAVKGYVETLQLGAKEDAETCTHFLNQIHLQSERLERLINDMLQLARAQTGADRLRVADIPLSPVLAESVAAYEPLARARGVQLRFSPSAVPAAVTADREALVTITNNLVGNAVRYTPSGGHVDVTIHTAGDRWAIVVADDGIGIPEADQQRIFERFYRVEKARDANLGGTGLGLSIVKNLVQALGGEVRLKSCPGKGSTFEILLPRSDTAAALPATDSR